jgi:hypothetical protein
MIGLNWLNEHVSLIPSVAGDVRLRAKADHHRIRSRMRGIGRSDHGDVIVIDPTKCSGIAEVRSTSAQMETRLNTRGRTYTKLSNSIASTPLVEGRYYRQRDDEQDEENSASGSESKKNLIRGKGLDPHVCLAWLREAPSEII